MRILLVDEQPIIHRAVALVLREIAGEPLISAHTAEQGTAEFRRHRPDAMIVSDTLPDVSGNELIGAVLGLCPDAPIVVFAAIGGATEAKRALDIGALAFVGKRDAPELLVQAVESASNNAVWLPERLRQDIALQRLKGGEPQSVSSPRELAILSKLSRGSSLGEIGHDLGLSYKTVTNEVAGLRKKLGARTQPEMVRIAMEKGLLG
ncbi:MAG: response regulator transcription factor [Alphaproteobacteria bacterium]|nr:response regulator transcription factor [Alphaproteobacteria bacterium]